MLNRFAFQYFALVGGLLASSLIGAEAPPSTYALGQDDQLTITVLDLEEVSTKAPVRIDSRGDVTLPMVGRVHAAGLTPEQLEEEIEKRLAKYLQVPDVTVSLVEMRSQPISVLGAVASPGVHQLQGHKNLFEVLSMVGGIRQDAGYQIKVTRRSEWGKIPLPGAEEDPTGRFSTASVSVKSIMDATNPAENIEIKPQDVISVPKGQLIYVIGAVQKSGGFVLGENESLSALEILSLAEGLARFADSKKTKIMRAVGNSQIRTEIKIDLKAILEGKVPDVLLLPEDIFFVPTNGRKQATVRAFETALSMGTTITTQAVIYRR